MSGGITARSRARKQPERAWVTSRFRKCCSETYKVMLSGHKEGQSPIRVLRKENQEERRKVSPSSPSEVHDALTSHVRRAMCLISPRAQQLLRVRRGLRMQTVDRLPNTLGGRIWRVHGKLPSPPWGGEWSGPT